MIRGVPALPLLHVITTSLAPAVVLVWPQGELVQGDGRQQANPPQRGSSQCGVVLAKSVIKQQQAQAIAKSYHLGVFSHVG